MIFIVAGNLIVNVLARTRDFVSNIGRARTEVKRFGRETRTAGRQVNTTLGNLRTIGLQLGAGALFAGATSFLRNQAQMIDALGKTSTRLGVSAEALQFYQFAARQASVATNTYNMAMQRLTRRIGEFAIGSGEAKDTLEGLGFTVEQLQAMSPEEQFDAMLQSLRGITDQNERLRVAFKLFDSEGVAVLQMVRHLDEARKNFEEFNLAVDNADVQQIEQLVSNFRLLQEATAAMARRGFIDISPEVQNAIEGALEIIRAAQARERPEGVRRPASTTLGAIARVGTDLARTRDAQLLGDLIIGAISGQTGPLARSEQRTRELEFQRQAEVATNPRQMEAGAFVTDDYLERIEMNTRKPRDGT